MSGTVETEGICIEGLEKSFGAETVLRGIDLVVEPGEFCIVIGPSGSGKSSLLKCIAGLAEPDRGRVLIDGQDVTETPVNNRDIGFVFQEFEETLFPHMSVAENVAFGLTQSAKDFTTDEIETRVTEILELLAIPEIREDSPEELSGGQQQRVELARQLVRGCEVMLFDDPLADLDYKLQKRMELELRRFHAETGGTYLYVTHNQEQALSLADKLVVLEDGRIEQAGTPTEIYENPKNAYVGRFVGDSNLFEASVSAVDEPGQLEVETPIGPITARPGHDGIATDDHGVVLIRPENVAIGEDADAVANRFTGRPLDRTYTGERTEGILSVVEADRDAMVESILPGNVLLEEFRGEETLPFGWEAGDATFFSQLSSTGETTVETLKNL